MHQLQHIFRNKGKLNKRQVIGGSINRIASSIYKKNQQKSIKTCLLWNGGCESERLRLWVTHASKASQVLHTHFATNLQIQNISVSEQPCALKAMRVPVLYSICMSTCEEKRSQSPGRWPSLSHTTNNSARERVSMLIAITVMYL